MLLSYQWLQEWVDLSGITPEALADKMSRTGIEIEDVFRPMDGLKKIVVGEVKECIEHPNSDHLHICQVDIGKEVTQIVCGAPNVAAGQKVIVALPGARIADNVKIKKGKMRGEVSNGMLCALEEINIKASVTPKEYSEGIYILQEDAVNGAEVFPYLGMDDAYLDMAITPNRADALSLYGTAYEVAAIYNKEVTVPTYSLAESTTTTASEVVAENQIPELVPTFFVRKIKGVQVAPSPRWLQNRLMHAGICPVNNVVDALNYMMLMYGAPMHAYDASKVASLTVAQATAGETFVALNGEEYTLQAEDIVIRDGDHILALGGVIGGEACAVTEATTDILIEAALFQPASIRKTSQAHHLRTEASQRFEKGINKAMPGFALDATAAFIQSLAGGEVLQDKLGVTVAKVHDEVVRLSLSRLNAVLGMDLTLEEVLTIFARLQFPTEVVGEDLLVSIPPRRFDIHIPADLIEEVVRLYGYDRLPSTLPIGAVSSGQLTEKQKITRHLRTQLESFGCQEVISYALLDEKEAKAFALTPGESVALDFPMSQDHAFLRQSLISGLLNDVQYNQARQNKDLALYEVGTVFKKQDQGLPKEESHLAFALTGQRQAAQWNHHATNYHFYYAKGMVEALCHYLSFATPVTYQASQREGMHPGRCADVYVGDTCLGYFGELHPVEAQARNLERIYVGELNIEALVNLPKTGIQFAEVSKFPTVTRDIAILVDEAIQNADLERCIQENGGRFLIAIQLFDLYMGDKVAAGKKSLAYQCEFMNTQATLTDEEINQAMQKITRALETQYQATIR